MPTRNEAWPDGTPCWSDLAVDDPAAARDFYVGMFGWDIVDTGDETGHYMLASRDDHQIAGIGPKMQGAESAPSAWTTYLAAADLDGTTEKARESGAQVLAEPFDVMESGRMAVLADPTGGAFGLWQAGQHTGFGIVKEHGTVTWNELHTRDYAAAKDFYGTVFGFSFEEVGDGVNMAYSTFARPGDDEAIGGINDDTKMPGEGPAYWLTWFEVDDCDAAIAKSTELGATVLMGPDDSPFGRMGIVQSPTGEVVGLIDGDTRTGDAP